MAAQCSLYGRRDGCALCELTEPDRRRCVRRAVQDLDRSMPPWSWARLDSPLWRDRVRFAQLRALATQWTPSAGSVLISAPSRAGKTAGCVALVHRLIAEATATADPAHIATSTAWISGLALADEWRRTAYGTRSGLIEHAARVRLLVLDELGQEDARPAWLLEVLDQRYVRALPTLSTTGLRIGELTARYGSGAVARLVEPVGATVEVWGG